jgi:dihydrofolate synthase/folylpolyglutamate synthase
MAEFAKRIELPGSIGDGKAPKFIHVAGTNGKGSVTAMLQSCLIEQGYRTGAFFSPYVVNPRERIQFGRDMISEQELADLTTKLMPIGESLSETEFGGVTEFEFKTAMGFEFWKQKKCDWVALEVGLGGRLDATNIVEPASSAIVSISYDHVSILGSTLAEIAREKAGIIKPGRPVVVGEMPDEAFEVIEQIAIDNCSLLWKIGREVIWEKSRDGMRITSPYSTINLKPGLFGEIQLHNAAVAFSALELAHCIKDRKALEEGFSKAYLPGRFQKIEFKGKRFILDGAHNADSAAVLQRLLIEAGIHPKICITGMLSGHSPEEFYQTFDQTDTEYFVTPIDFHRTMDPTELSISLQKLGFNAQVFDSVKAAIDAALKFDGSDDILVCGSFYLVGEVMRQLQLQ